MILHSIYINTIRGLPVTCKNNGVLWIMTTTSRVGEILLSDRTEFICQLLRNLYYDLHIEAFRCGSLQKRGLCSIKWL